MKDNYADVTSDDFVFVREIEGHRIYLGKNSGRFLVDYARDADLDRKDEDGDDDYGIDSDKSGTRLQAWHDTLRAASDYCYKRTETRERVKRTPLDLKCATATREFTVKGIHAGNGRLLIREKGPKAELQRSYYNRADSGTVFPRHPFIDAVLAKVREQQRIIDDAEKAKAKLFETIYPMRIDPIGSRASETDETFAERHAQAVALADAAVGN